MLCIQSTSIDQLYLYLHRVSTEVGKYDVYRSLLEFLNTYVIEQGRPTPKIGKSF